VGEELYHTTARKPVIYKSFNTLYHNPICWPNRMFNDNPVYSQPFDLHYCTAVLPYHSYHPSAIHFTNECFDGCNNCAAKAFYSCPAIISHRPGSQNTSKESQLNSEKDSRRKQARSHVTLEKSS
jgi:hypothetical protein